MGTIPLPGGDRIGAIVLPADPSLAERYAAHELQRYLYRVFGAIVGLQGRDVDNPEEVAILIGRAVDPATLETLDGLPDDSYLVGQDATGIVLAGNTDLGTLYAAYDLLGQQGCRWHMPGTIGEVVPARAELSVGAVETEVPDHQLRGYSLQSAEFFPAGGWIYFDADEHMDWAVRNRFNAMWAQTAEVHDLEAHRGHGWVQLTGHSWNSLVAPYQVHFVNEIAERVTAVYPDKLIELYAYPRVPPGQEIVHPKVHVR